MNLMSCLSESGVLVSYGGTSRKPMVVNPGSLIFKKHTIRGFWLLLWYQSAKPDAIVAMFDHLAPLIAAGTISTPVAATYRFDQVKDAITHAGQSGRQVLFAPTLRRPRVDFIHCATESISFTARAAGEEECDVAGPAAY